MQAKPRSDRGIRRSFEEKYAEQNFPATEVVELLLPRCPQDNYILFRATAVCDGREYEKAFCCPLCGCAYIVPTKTIWHNFISGETLYVCRSYQSCIFHKHRVESRKGILASLSLQAIELNVNYCCDCKKHFITRESYEQYRKMYGAFMGILYWIDSPQDSYSTTDFYGREAESPLHLSGYNVSQRDNLSDAERRRILAFVMEQGILSKNQVISYLEMFIKFREGRPHMELAIYRWRKDLAWVNACELNSQVPVRIKGIERYF